MDIMKRMFHAYKSNSTEKDEKDVNYKESDLDKNLDVEDEQNMKQIEEDKILKDETKKRKSNFYQIPEKLLKNEFKPLPFDISRYFFNHEDIDESNEVFFSQEENIKIQQEENELIDYNPINLLSFGLVKGWNDDICKYIENHTDSKVLSKTPFTNHRESTWVKFYKNGYKKICPFDKRPYQDIKAIRYFLIQKYWIEERCSNSKCTICSDIVLIRQGVFSLGMLSSLFPMECPQKNFDDFLNNVIRNLNNFFGLLCIEDKYVEKIRNIDNLISFRILTAKQLEKTLGDPISIRLRSNEDIRLYSFSLFGKYILSNLIETYNNIDFIPYSPKLSNNSFVCNFFGGFNMLYDKDYEIISENINPILNHITKIWCDSDIEKSEDIISQIAQTLQKPEEYPEIGIILKSNNKEKDIVLKFLEEKIFHPYSKNINVSKISSDEILPLTQQKLFLVLDGNDDPNINLTFKSLQSKNEFIFHQQGYGNITMKYYGRYIMYTNQEMSKTFSFDKKRIILNMTNKENQDEELLKALNNERTRKDLFHYLLRKDISNFKQIRIPEIEQKISETININEEKSILYFNI